MSLENTMTLNSATTIAGEICRVIVLDHKDKIHVLCEENYQKLHHILKERVNWHRSIGEWSAVILWCDLLLGFTKNVDIGERIMAMLWKVEALLSIQRPDEAYILAKESVLLSKSTKTLLVCFHIIIYGSLFSHMM
jgi:hypothetical protein